MLHTALQSTSASVYLLMHQWVSVAQFPAGTESDTPEATSVLISGPKFFIALISGILLAFAIQLLLTNFSLAAGIATARAVRTGTFLWTRGARPQKCPK